VARADSLFSEHAASLARDYGGMMLFRRLAAESLAQGPVTAETMAAVEGTKDALVFDRILYRLTETGRLLVPGERSGPSP
jgi:hypothetical protein